MALKTAKSSKKNKDLLKELIYEYRNGKPIYLKDYEKVLSGKLSKEDIMGSSSLHALLVMIIGAYLMEVFGKDYLVLGGELGYIPRKGTRYNLDIAVFEREKLLKEGLKNRYTHIPPLLVVEIDTKVDTRKFGGEEGYIFTKTKDLLESGVELVLWFLTREKKVLYAPRGRDWIVTDWDRDLELPNGGSINPSNLLNERGIKLT